MASGYAKSKGRGKPSYIGFPRAVVDHPNFMNLSGSGVKLLVDLYQQYRGYNNGDLTPAWTILKKRLWKSKLTRDAALAELLHYGFICLTRQGGRNICSLYAVTWYPIDECLDKNKQHKLDIQPMKALGLWKEVHPVWSRKKWHAARTKRRRENENKKNFEN